ncbi:MAG: UxaA family hydrolase [Bacillota bacterium]|jgi:altronate dehydratase large subunit
MILSDRFLGYKRENGSIGVRNYVGVLACSACAVPAARRISEAVNGTALFTHNQGCCAADADLEATRRTLVSLALNPNLHSVLFVALGCEGLPVEQIVEETCLAGKHAELISVENCGGTSLAVAQGTFRAEEMVVEASRAERCEASLSDLTIGIKCGDSDAISGLGANRVVGHVVDSLVAKGCTCLVTEVTELIGAEHVLARRAVDAIVSRKIVDAVETMERRLAAHGVHPRSAGVSIADVSGGLTTIEEKSLGALTKTGTCPVSGVYPYGERVTGKGLMLIDGPGREPEALTALAAGGAHVILFTTGHGSPQGFPFVPVLKITGNLRSYKRAKSHIDVSVCDVLDAWPNVDEAAAGIEREVIAVSSGKRTRAEVTGYYECTDIYTTGLVF